MKRILAILAVLVLASSAQAVLTTWTGGNANWKAAGNWENGVPTAANPGLIANGSLVNGNGDIAGATVTLTGGSGVKNVWVSGWNNQISTAFVIGAGGGKFAFTGNGDFKGGVTLGGDLTLDLAFSSSSKFPRVSGLISGAGDIYVTHSTGGNAGGMYLGGGSPNTFSGDLYVQYAGPQGALNAYNAAGAGGYQWGGSGQATRNNIHLTANASTLAPRPTRTTP